MKTQCLWCGSEAKAIFKGMGIAYRIRSAERPFCNGECFASFNGCPVENGTIEYINDQYLVREI